MQGIMETLFDVVYLCSVITLGCIILKRNDSNKPYKMFGLMAVILGCGDAFHLVPRAYALLTDGLANHPVSLGFGKLVTSITMTIFYCILYQVWRARYNIQGRKNLTYCFYSLAGLRVILCLFPQNLWTSPTPSLLWGILRNIPFAIMGIIVIVLFFQQAKLHNDKNFRLMWLAITISFACYVPVVLWAEMIPLVGMLMIPKTVAYAWIVVMGFLDKGKTFPQK